MSTIHLRNVISEYLSHIDDVSFLNAIKTIVESKASEKTYNLSENESKRVEEGRKQYKKRQTIPDEQLKNEIEQWLKTK
jgi:Zn-dependent M32 family carboxypeptidase